MILVKKDKTMDELVNAVNVMFGIAPAVIKKKVLFKQTYYTVICTDVIDLKKIGDDQYLLEFTTPEEAAKAEKELRSLTWDITRKDGILVVKLYRNTTVIEL